VSYSSIAADRPGHLSAQREHHGSRAISDRGDDAIPDAAIALVSRQKFRDEATGTRRA
jgi:hypothetical protein